MKKIKRVGRIKPRGHIAWFANRADEYERLRDGETIDVPDDIVALIGNVVETEEDLRTAYKSHASSHSKKKHTSTKAKNIFQVAAEEEEIKAKSEEEGDKVDESLQEEDKEDN